MLYRSFIGFIALAGAIGLTVADAAAFDETKYPDWKGQWVRQRTLRDRVSPNPSFDPNKYQGLAQEAPLTPEYQAILEASLADQAAGGAGLDRDYVCFPAGMPRMMNVYSTMEVIVMPEVTHILMGFLRENRRIFTDGRDWPAGLEPSSRATPSGNGSTSDGDGRFDVLRGGDPRFQGPAHLRQHRPAAAPGQPDHRQGADLSRQVRSQCPARRDHRDRPRLHASLDGAQGLQPLRASRSRPGASWSAWRRTSMSASATTATCSAPTAC